MSVTPTNTSTCKGARQFGRVLRAGAVMVFGPFLWGACNSGDATAPIAAAPTQPSLPTPPATVQPVVVSRVIAPDTVLAGSTIVFEGSGFSAAASGNTVTLSNAAVSVISATPTRLEVRVPLAGALPCLRTGPQSLRVTSNGRSEERSVIVRVATRVQLARGESVNLLNEHSAACTEFVAPAGDAARYTMAVINTSQDVAASTGFEVRSAASPASAFVAAPMMSGFSSGATFGTSPAGSFAGSFGAKAHGLSQTDLNPTHDHHAEHLERQAQLASRTRAAVPAWRDETARRGAFAMSRAPMMAGQTVSLNAMYTSCSSSARVNARVVYAGTRAVVLEDVASPRAGTMDAEYRALGQEFDAVMYPLLAEQIGDPLALDRNMGGDGRVTMLFTRFVNDSAAGTAGYVTSCNLYPRTTIATSNEDEIFYARVPHAGETVSAWRRSMRSTVMHEAKHLAAFAERMASNTPLEEPWMEEATARIAEELYGRTFSNGATAWKSNAGWTEGLHCEVYQCNDQPLVMWKHVPVLHDYFAGVDTLSPLGRAAAGDFTYYASGWSLVRWAVDHYAANEGAFLRDLIKGGAATGMNALAARTGRPVAELLADWALANAVDDRAGFTPARRTLTFPSWNVPELMAGLNAMNGGRYSAQPLRVRQITGDAQVAVPQLRGFSASYLETAIAAGGSQLVELRGAQGGAVSGAIRLAIVRVE